MSEYFRETVLENYALKGLCELTHRFPSTTRRVSAFAGATTSKFEKIRHSHQVFSTDRSVRFNEMEYNVPLEAYQDVMREVTECVNTHNKTVMFPLENRFVKGDDIFLSPAYNRDSAYIAAHVYHKKPYKEYFRRLEEIFIAYDGRPHWGKIHTRTAEDFRELYPKFDQFCALRDAHDPDRIFSSPYLESIIATPTDVPLSAL